MVSVAAGAGAAAHPRVSGENAARIIVRARHFGSSPRERGKLVIGQPENLHSRLIPA